MCDFILGFTSCIGLLLIVFCMITGVAGRMMNRINACLLDAVTQGIITIEQEKKLEQLLNKGNK
jgi:hypothetical protein